MKIRYPGLWRIDVFFESIHVFLLSRIRKIFYFNFRYAIVIAENAMERKFSWQLKGKYSDGKKDLDDSFGVCCRSFLYRGRS